MAGEVVNVVVNATTLFNITITDDSNTAVTVQVPNEIATVETSVIDTTIDLVNTGTGTDIYASNAGSIFALRTLKDDDKTIELNIQNFQQEVGIKLPDVGIKTPDNFQINADSDATANIKLVGASVDLSKAKLITDLDANSQDLDSVNLITAVTGDITTVNSTTGNITTVNATDVNSTDVTATTGDITTVNSTNVNSTNLDVDVGDIASFNTASLTATTADINAGSIDNTTIGATVSSTGTFSTMTTSNAQITGGSMSGTTIDLTGVNTLTLTPDSVSGDMMHGGTISNFASTGIDDNATSTQMTITDTLVTFGDDVTVTGDLTINGTTTTVNTETINLADNNIVLNSNETGTPTEDGGITVERGTSDNALLQWNEATDKWEAKVGSSYAALKVEDVNTNTANITTGVITDLTATLNNSPIGGTTPTTATFTTATATTGDITTVNSTTVNSTNVNSTNLDVDVGDIASFNTASMTATTADINGGTFDGIVGGTTPAAVTTTSLIATTADINGGSVDATTVGATTSSTGRFSTLESASVDLNGGAIDGTTIGASSPSTIVTTDLTATTVDINSGTIDGTVVGGSTPAAVSTTSLVATTADINAGTIDNTVIGGTVPNTVTTTSLVATTADINAGTIDATTVGATTSSTGTFSTLTSASVALTGGAISGTDVDMTGETFTLADNQLSGDKIDGGTISNFTSTGIDDNADQTVLTLGADESASFAGAVTVTGNLTVNGTETIVNTETLTVDDNIIVLNNNVTGTPTENSGIEIERGTSDNALLQWNETTDKWEAKVGTAYASLKIEDIDLNTADITTANITDLTAATADINGGTIDNTTIGATTPSAVTTTSLIATTVDINAGTIDGTTIGATTPSAVTTTSLIATTADINAGSIDGTTVGATVPSTIVTTDLTATTADINAGTIDGSIIGGAVPAAVTTTSLVATTVDIEAGTLDNVVIGGTTPNVITTTDLTATTADLNGGTIDNMTIGATTPSTIVTTDLTATTADINAGTIDATTIGATTPSTIVTTDLTATTADINAGTVDNTVIGATTPVAGTFTTATATTGDITTVNSTTLNSGTINSTGNGNNITLNSGVTGTPTANAGIIVERGTETDALLQFNETDDRWEFSNSDLRVDGTLSVDYIEDAFQTTTNILHTQIIKSHNFETTFPYANKNEVNIHGSLIPNGNKVWDLGSSTMAYKSIYVGDGSLYIDGHKVLGSDATGEINITTDDTQDLWVVAGGPAGTSSTTGELYLESRGNHTHISDTTITMGPTSGGTTVDINGTLDVNGVLEASSADISGLNINGTTISDANNTAGSITLTTDTSTGYIHANTADMYVGSFTDSIKIDNESITRYKPDNGDLSILSNGTGKILLDDLTVDNANSGYGESQIKLSTPVNHVIALETSGTGYIYNLAPQTWIGDGAGAFFTSTSGSATTLKPFGGQALEIGPNPQNASMTVSLTGDVTGNVLGNLTGDVTGNLTDDGTGLVNITSKTLITGSVGGLTAPILELETDNSGYNRPQLMLKDSNGDAVSIVGRHETGADYYQYNFTLDPNNTHGRTGVTTFGGDYFVGFKKDYSDQSAIEMNMDVYGANGGFNINAFDDFNSGSGNQYLPKTIRFKGSQVEFYANNNERLTVRDNKLTVTAPLVLSNESGDPGSPESGMTYFNTTTNKFRGYNGSAWVDLG